MKTKNLFTLFIALFICYTTRAQKLYVWHPTPESVQTKHYLKVDQTVKLIIYDGRKIPNSHIKCSSAELLSHITDIIIKSYPNIKFNVLGPEAYYQDFSEKNEYIIKIGIYGYFALFRGYFDENRVIHKELLSTTWRAMTAYEVTIYNGKKTRTESITETASTLNTYGYKSAKKILNETYKKANEKIFNYIDEEFKY